jgi:predicted Rossmann fold flavoprotein
MKSSKPFHLAIIGAGAAGVFLAANLAQRKDIRISIFEKSARALDKVRISGGGRCNVTHACFVPKEWIQYYPRGNKELMGPFNKFSCGDTMEWFESRGVPLKMEDDGRVFPVSDSSMSIIECLMNSLNKQTTDIHFHHAVQRITKENDQWQIDFSQQSIIKADAIAICAGSSNTVWNLLKELGHSIVPPVPSLFTFNCKDKRIADLPGVAVDYAEVELEGSAFAEGGPLLITHWGLSGPAILKLSARAARYLNEQQYRFRIRINFTGWEVSQVNEHLLKIKKEFPSRSPYAKSLFEIPNRMWKNLLKHSSITETQTWHELNNRKIEELAEGLARAVFEINGKSTNKDEFVTAGGVDLKEVDFRTMQSKQFDHLYFAGEVLNIDALTGGFNFQAAWTEAWLIAQTLQSRLP